jgi:pyridoxal phosphate enzyme (YggS family)
MTVKENLKKISKEIEQYHPKIIAVTKYYNEEKMIEAFNAGLRDFAESKAVEAVKKINNIDDTTKSQSVYHFIGHLQTNKVKYVEGNFEYIHSVDSLKIAQYIDFEAKKKGIIQKILIQVNNAQETQKFGIPVVQLENLINEVKKLNSIELVGLMNIAPLTEDEEELQRLFLEMKELKEKFNLKELSMGMSHDYKLAVKCGATMIRLGRILFENN